MEKLIALFDALQAADVGHAVVQFHDTDGSLAKIARTWAAEHGAESRLIKHPSVYSTEIVIRQGVTVVVHDMQTFHADDKSVAS